jgi:hypothetical protein
MHINAGAKSAVLSAPSKGEGVPTYVISVNDTNIMVKKLLATLPVPQIV